MTTPVFPIATSSIAPQAVDDAGRILSLLRSYRFRYRNEADLQEALAGALQANQLPVQREVRLSERDRVDLLIGKVAIEVKLKGPWSHVARQVARYTEHDLDALILITAGASRVRLPATLNGTRLHVRTLAKGGL